MMANLNERDRRALQIGGAGVGIILAFMLVGFPVMDYWDRVSKETEQQAKLLRSYEQSLNDQASASIALRELRQKATLHRSALELNEQTARMLQQVERLPGYTGLAVRRLEGMPLREEDGFFRSGVSMQFSGRLQNVQQFLESVETASPGLKVDRLTVSADSKDPSRVEGQMVVTGYAVVLGRSAKG